MTGPVRCTAMEETRGRATTGRPRGRVARRRDKLTRGDRRTRWPGSGRAAGRNSQTSPGPSQPVAIGVRTELVVDAREDQTAPDERSAVMGGIRAVTDTQRPP